jgi:hypothetical protein
MGRPKKVQQTLEAPTDDINPSAIEARASRIHAAAQKEKTALKALAESRAMRAELGYSEPGEGSEFDGPPQDPEAPGLSPSKLDTILSELNNDGRFEMQRREGMTWVEVGGADITDYPDKLFEIAKDCGGGKFRITFRDSHGHYAGMTTREFDPRVYAPKTPASPEDRTSSVLLEMQKMMLQQSEAHKRDMMDLMKTILTAQGAQGSLLKTSEDLKNLMSAFKSDTPAHAAVSPIEMTSTILKAAMELKDLTSSNGPEGSDGGEPDSGSFIKSVIAQLLSAARGGNGNGQAGALAALAPPPQAPAQPFRPAAPPAPAPTPPAASNSLGSELTALPSAPIAPALPAEDPNPLMRYKTHPLVMLYLPVLLDMAQRGMAPDLVAEIVLSRIPEAYHLITCDTITRPDFKDLVKAYDKRFESYTPWLDAVVKEIDSYIRNSAEEPEAVTAPVSFPEGALVAEGAHAVQDGNK